jgi:hypothetical protein
MLHVIKGCVPSWLNWKIGAVIALVLVILVEFAGLPRLSFLVGASPLVLLAACLLPCLIPLALLRKNGRPAAQSGEQSK